MFIIAGLGNPGLKYRNTRHNVGFIAVDALIKKMAFRSVKKNFQSAVFEGSISGQRVLVLKPQTYMNLSGKAIKEAVNFYKLPYQNLIVIYDDIDLDEGRLRIKPSGSAGTHNGMRSIISELGTGDFPRIRIGIGKNPPFMDLKDYVLAKLKGDSKQRLCDACLRGY